MRKVWDAVIHISDATTNPTYIDWSSKAFADIIETIETLISYLNSNQVDKIVNVIRPLPPQALI